MAKSFFNFESARGAKYREYGSLKVIPAVLIFGHLITFTPLYRQSVSSGFVGCMRDFKQKDTRLENKEAPVEIGTSLCSGDSEDGTYFGSNGGYIKLCELDDG